MNKYRKLSITLLIISVIFIILGGTLSLWTWNSSENKNVVFNTASNLQDYIIYDEGESKFVGDFQVSDSYLDGVHTTISLYKTEEVNDVDLYATINMDINSIGKNIKSLPGLKWVVTSGNSTDSNREILSQGNFLGVNDGDTLVLYNNIEVLTTKKEFTIWLWLDSSTNLDSELTGETIDTSVWTQIDQIIENRYEITNISVYNKMISATVVNSTANIMYYQVTTSNTEPIEWIEIPEEDIGNIYTLEYNSINSGTNYVWFKDSNNKVISKDIYVYETYNITYLDIGGTTFSGTHEEGYLQNYNTGSITYLDMPIKEGYSFSGYYLNSDGSDEVITSISGNQVGNLTLYAKWIDNVAPYGVANLSLNDGVFKLSLSDYGDKGSGIVNAYGYAISTSSTCSGASYIESSELSMGFNNTYEAGTKYYGCIKLTDNNGNIRYIVSGGIEYKLSHIEELYTTPGSYEYVVPQSGEYTIELWGAQGGGAAGGKGGYTSGKIDLEKNTNLYIYVGEYKSYTSDMCYSTNNNNTFNCSNTGSCSGGGGSTDVRLLGGEWNDSNSIKSRIMVAAGGGGSLTDFYGGSGGAGGGITGYAGAGGNNAAPGGTQISGGSFGIGSGSTTISGNGYWSGTRGNAANAGGGSSYISGHTGCVAIVSEDSTSPRTGTNNASCTTGTTDNLCSLHYSSKYFTDTVMIDGKGYSWTNVKGSLQQMPNPSGGYYTGGVGHSGNGAAKITAEVVIEKLTIAVNYDNNNGSGCHSKSVTVGELYGSLCTPVRSGYTFDGWYTSMNGSTLVTSDTLVTSEVDHTIYAHWTKATSPVITFETNGNDGYTKEGISSRIIVSKGNNVLDTKTFKYTFSKNSNAEPTNSFINGNTYSLNEGEGIYYLIAEACDVDGKCTRQVSEPFYLDTVAPNGSLELSINNNTITANVNASDSESGIKNFGYLIQTTDICPTTGYIKSINTNYNFNLPGAGLFYVCVKVVDNVNNVKYLVSNVIENTYYTFSEPQEYEYVVQSTGYYQLEAWGASGGNASSTYIGGYGGYSTGIVHLNEGDVIYINVGGKGVTTSTAANQTAIGGYNGGGSGKNYYDTGRIFSSGGGATHIATKSGVLSTLSSSVSDVLIVAGGGGGSGYHTTDSSYYGSGGSGGGFMGSNSPKASHTKAQGGTQTDGAAFGQGGDASSTEYAGGGGGYYGGKAGFFNAAGGSGYIGNSLLTDKYMYCYNCSESNGTSTKTFSTTNASDQAISNYAKMGNGYAKITFLPDYMPTGVEIGYNEQFDFVGKEQTFIAPSNGYYQLEVWGAQGGNSNTTYIGGYGGYSTGVVHLNEGEEIYINVGGIGAATSTAANQTVAGGYNGGGSGRNYSGSGRILSSGGGATHIATQSGVLSSLSNNVSSILIVAGGGGGSGYYSSPYYGTGGHAGGFEGMSSSNTGQTKAQGGTQTSGASFGQGGNASSTEYAGGGGGYYGGKAGFFNAAGGSGYIGNSLLTDKYMYCYNCTTSDEESIKTYTTTNVSSAPTSDYAKTGNGYAIITLVSLD